MINQKLPYGYGLAFLTRFGLFIRKLNLRRWTWILWGLTLATASLFSYLKSPAPATGPTTPFDHSIITLMCFFLGLPGFLFAYRKEALSRGNGTYRGKDAFGFGLFLMLLWWGCAVYNFYLEVKLLFGLP